MPTLCFHIISRGARQAGTRYREPERDPAASVHQSVLSGPTQEMPFVFLGFRRNLYSSSFIKRKDIVLGSLGSRQFMQQCFPLFFKTESIVVFSFFFLYILTLKFKSKGF